MKFYCPMIRVVFTSLVVAASMTGCSFDVDSIKQEADKLQKEINSSNLKDCKDEEGKPLPEWMCRKDENADDNKAKSSE